MLRKLLPLVFALIGTAAGIGAGLAMKSDAVEDPSSQPENEEQTDNGDDAQEDAASAYVKLPKQFVVPVINEHKIKSLVVITISLEVAAGSTEAVYALEPKLRDVLLQVFLDHANIGGFDGDFTNGVRMNILREAMNSAVKTVLGADFKAVLITEIARQDN